MFQQALELRVELLIVFHTVREMPLHHPFDMQRRDCNAERIVRQNRSRNRRRWPNNFTMRAEAVFKLLPETLEELNVLRLFTRKLQQRAHAVIVAAELRPSVVQHKRQDELFNETEDAQIRVAANLIQNQLLFAIEKPELLDARQRLRHERPGEVEPLLAADDVFYAPMANFRCGEGGLIRISIEHFWNTSYGSY